LIGVAVLIFVLILTGAFRLPIVGRAGRIAASRSPWQVSPAFKPEGSGSSCPFITTVAPQ